MLKNINQYRTIVQERALKVRSDYQDVFLKKVPMKLIKTYGSKTAAIVFTLLSIQKSVIKNDKQISCPSILSLALAHHSSIRHVTRVISFLVNNGSLHIRNYFKFDVNGEIVTRTTSLGKKCNNIETTRKVTDGKLRMILNPFSKVKEFIQSKASDKTSRAENYVEAMFEKFVRNFWSNQEFDESYANDVGSVSDDVWKIFE